ncbi:hypothetical protein BGZ46_008338 [Entomortierella lignicola]|nr:hypothetical protein BGZ46_008338 [Entomortierella lignicola]
MTNNVENKHSTAETIKEKAAHLFEKATGKTHEAESTTAEPPQAHVTDHQYDQVPGQYNVKQDDVNSSALLSSDRLPRDNTNAGATNREEITRPNAVYDQNHQKHHHAAEIAAGAAGAEAVHHHYKHNGDHINEHDHGHNHHGAEAAAAAAGAEAVHHHYKHSENNGEHGHYKIDDPQRGIISRVVGEPGDPNNLTGNNLKPTM